MDRPSPIRGAQDTSGQKVYVQFCIHVEVALSDGTLVPETLQKLKFYVGETLYEFTPEFSATF